MKKFFNAKDNFLGITEPELYQYHSAKTVLQLLPYEYTSSYHSGSAKGPAAIVKASQYVEFYDEELGFEPFRNGGICTLEPVEFANKVDAGAVELIERHTQSLLQDDKFVVSLGAEHTVTYGVVKAFQKKYPNLSVLQFDAHSDLRDQYEENPYSHASVMARVHELQQPTICQVGIRAQCIEEAEFIKASPNIHTYYMHHIRQNPDWMQEAVDTLSDQVYITIDADGFDPSVVPAVGTAEPNGMMWGETMQFFKMVMEQKEVVGFDVVEVAPVEQNTLSEYTLAKMIYRLLGYKAAASVL